MQKKIIATNEVLRVEEPAKVFEIRGTVTGGRAYFIGIPNALTQVAREFIDGKKKGGRK